MKYVTSLLYRLWYRAFPHAAYLSFPELLANPPKELWVVNTSQDYFSGQGEHVPENTELLAGAVMAHDGPHFRVVRVKVHASWLPEPLHAQLPVDDLFAEPNFRRLVVQGLVKIVRPSYATAVLHSKAAKKEQQRLLNLREVVKQSAYYRTIR